MMDTTLFEARFGVITLVGQLKHEVFKQPQEYIRWYGACIFLFRNFVLLEDSLPCGFHEAKVSDVKRLEKVCCGFFFVFFWVGGGRHTKDIMLRSHSSSISLRGTKIRRRIIPFENFLALKTSAIGKSY